VPDLFQAYAILPDVTVGSNMEREKRKVIKTIHHHHEFVWFLLKRFDKFCSFDTESVGIFPEIET